MPVFSNPEKGLVTLLGYQRPKIPRENLILMALTCCAFIQIISKKSEMLASMSGGCSCNFRWFASHLKYLLRVSGQFAVIEASWQLFVALQASTWVQNILQFEQHGQKV